MYRSLTCGEQIRVVGTVQGVGFRPAVWRLAKQLGVAGRVWNDAQGVLIEVWGSREKIDALVGKLQTDAPPLAHIHSIDRSILVGEAPASAGFHISSSRHGPIATSVAADAATCPACLAEIGDPADRRYRYPFTNCTHCGPRLSIVRSIPYDRANTSMAAFPMCGQCQAEYDDPADRRFHAQPNACPECGPEVWLEASDGAAKIPDDGSDAIAVASSLILAGAIVAIKGIGGIHLACDAGNAKSVDRLRRRKHRFHKALALMVCDVEMAGQIAEVGESEIALLKHSAAPVVVMVATGESLAPGIAPGHNTLGVMLPYTPLHHLLMKQVRRPIVLTSGNRSDEPQVTSNQDARRRLGKIADYFLFHNRDIEARLDDSVMCVVDAEPRFLRRARGFAPQPVPLGEVAAGVSNILAMGGELKNSFCLLRQGSAILSQHIGDLEDSACLRDYGRNLEHYRRLFDFSPAAVVVDKHPDYLSTQLGRSIAAEQGVPVVEVQHHHAHIVSCMAEHDLTADGEPVVGVALDGLGYGTDRTLWGGEFLLADYAEFKRLVHFQPMLMLGGVQAIHQPWRNTLAHLFDSMGWEKAMAHYGQLEIIRFLGKKPLAALRTMAQKGVNSPLTSSAGRLFDAVAAALGVCRESVGYEGQAAIELEALAKTSFVTEEGFGYRYELCRDSISWKPLWPALLNDLGKGLPRSVIAARFHHGVVSAVVDVAALLCAQQGTGTVVLSGGVFQNQLLLERSSELLRRVGLRVLSPRLVPTNDGGLSLGQAAVAAARGV